MSDNPTEQPVTGNLPSTQTMSPADVPEWYSAVPAKFKGPDGSPNFETLTKSYVELEKWKGTVERPPESFDKYALPKLEGIELKDEQFAPFKEWPDSKAIRGGDRGILGDRQPAARAIHVDAREGRGRAAQAVE
jgi:hypothetical protein